MHIEAFQNIVGLERVLSSSAEKKSVDKPWREAEPSDKFLAVVDWSSEAELQQIMRYCSAHNIGIIPRAGGTSLSYSSSVSTHRDREDLIILRDAREPEYEIEGSSAKIIGNVTARKIETEQNQWIIPVDLAVGSKLGFATILGYIATDAAGSGAAFKGRAADMVESLRVMTVDGKIWDLPSPISGAPKLSDVVGMGGTTAVILSAKIKLIHAPKERAVAALRVDDIGEMYRLLARLKYEFPDEMNLFERMNERLFDIVVDRLERNNRTETSWLKAGGDGDFIFIEVASNQEKSNLKSRLEEALIGIDSIITDDEKFGEWLLAYRVPNASTQGSDYAKEHGKMVAFDISLPHGDKDEFPSKALIAEIEEKFAGGVDILYFGHAAGLGDSQTALHFNPVLHKQFATKENVEWLYEKVYSEVAARGGNIVSEHGYGTKSVDDFKKYHPERYAEMAEKIAKFDPQNILNPGANVTEKDVALAAEKLAREKD